MYLKKKVLLLFVLLILLVASVSAARLPINNSDSDAWGDLLNAYLNISTDAFGRLRNQGNGTIGSLLNLAQGINALAIGDSTTASGDNSFAGGNASNASAVNSFAFGDRANASGVDSFALGNQTVASGANSFAIGQGITVTGTNSIGISINDSRGQTLSQNNVLSIMGGRVGINITNPVQALVVNGDLNVTGNSTIGAGTLHLTGSSIFFTGSTATGANSFAGGNSTTASGLNSFAFGNTSTTASGTASAAFGTGTTASGAASAAFGMGTTASGTASIAGGQQAVASGLHSFSMGNLANASNNDTFAFGDGANASGVRSLAFGTAVASGSDSIAMGESVNAIGANSFAFGEGIDVTGTNSVGFSVNDSRNIDVNAPNVFSVMGGMVGINLTNPTRAFEVNGAVNITGFLSAGLSAIIGAFTNVVTGDNSVALGSASRVTGSSSVALGNGSTVNGNNAVAMGLLSTAGGHVSIAAGEAVDARGANSMAFGEGINVTGANSVGFSVNDSRGQVIQASNVFSVMGGRVGINLTAPVQALVVEGAANITGNLTVGADIFCTTCIDTGDIRANAITNATISNTANISIFKLERAAAGQIIIFNGSSNNPEAVAVGAGATLAANGSLNIASGHISSAMIADGVVASGDIAADTITAADIASNAVGRVEILAGAVDNTHINGSNAISASNLRDVVNLTVGNRQHIMGNPGNGVPLILFNHTGTPPTSIFDMELNPGGTYFIRFFNQSTFLGGISGNGSNVAYETFTGSHWSQTDEKNLALGEILVSMDVLLKNSDKLPKVARTNKPNDARVYGVYGGTGGLNSVDTGVGEGELIRVASLGTGTILVTDTNGNINNGDLITTSSRPGYGQKQHDDLFHSYTVAKATESVDWTKINRDPKKGFKWKSIAATYHAG